MIVILMIVLLIGLQWVRTSRAEAHVLKYRFRLFALRDRLRWLAIEDTRLGKNWLYPYLDWTISGAIEILPHMSLWQTLALAPTVRARDDKLELVLQQLKQELGKPCNAPLKAIYDDFWQEIRNQLLDRHFVVRLEMRIGSAGFSGITRFLQALRARERRSLQSVLLSEPKNFTQSPVIGDCAMVLAAH